MRAFRFLLAAAVLAALTTTGVSAQGVRADDLYREIARARSLAATDGPAAERALRAQGFRLPALDLSKPLTEADLVAVAGALGVRVRTTRPESPVSPAQLAAFGKSFGAELAGAVPDTKQPQGAPPRPDPQPDKGKSKGFHKSPTEPY